MSETKSAALRPPRRKNESSAPHIQTRSAASAVQLASIGLTKTYR